MWYDVIHTRFLGENTMSIFAKRMRIAMDDRGIRQADLIISTGISSANLSMYLSSKRNPKQEYVYRIAEALSVNPEWLIGKSEDMEKPVANLDSILSEMDIMFSRLDNEDKRTVLSYIDFLLNQPKYKKGSVAG